MLYIGWIGYPQYAVGLPKMVRRFILNNKFKADYIFAVDLYSFIRLGALSELAAIIPLNYGVYLKTPTNFTLLLNTPKDPQSLLLKAEKRLRKIAKDIIARKNKPVRIRKGEGNATKYFSEAKFKVTNKCNLCENCAKVCPTNNITVNNGVLFSNNCEYCFACVHLCPQHSIYLNEAMLKRRQYLNPMITPSEIEEANMQDM